MQSPDPETVPFAPTIRVAVLASAKLLSELISRALANAPDIELVAHGTSIEELASAMVPCRECVLAYDGTTAGAIHALSAAAGNLIPERIVVFGLSENADVLRRCAEIGVGGMVDRNATLDEIIDAIRLVAAGDTFASPTLSATLRNRLENAARGNHNVLTKREMEIARLIAWGYSDAAICQVLNIPRAALDAHVGVLFPKLGVRDRSEVASRYVDVLTHSGGRPSVVINPPKPER